MLNLASFIFTGPSGGTLKVFFFFSSPDRGNTLPTCKGSPRWNTEKTLRVLVAYSRFQMLKEEKGEFRTL